MLAIPVRKRGSSLSRLPNPTGDEWPMELINWADAILAFQDRITQIIEGNSACAYAHPQVQVLLDLYGKMI